MPTLTDQQTFDCIIVGSGAAGLSAALSIQGMKTLVLSAGEDPYYSHTAYAQGGVAFPRDPADVEAHIQDTLLCGAEACDPAAVRLLIHQAEEVSRWLEELGVAWDRHQDGSLSLGREGAHSVARIRHAGGDATGQRLLQQLFRAALSKRRVVFAWRTRAWKILTDSLGICGIVVENSGNFVRLRTRRLLLASGGYSGLFRPTTSPTLGTGLGLMLAAEAGAALWDLEMIQFHPTALALPHMSSLPLLTEALRGAGATLCLEDGSPLSIPHPLGPLGPRDVVSRAIFQVQQQGQPVFLDARGVPQVVERFPTVARLVSDHGLDLRRDFLPVTVAAHYTMGGVASDLWGHTEIPGLWVAGEVACTRAHGANRLASNSLLECLVSGRLAGQAMEGQTIRHRPRALPDLEENDRVLGDDPARLHELGALLSRHAGPIRHQASLASGREKVRLWASSAVGRVSSLAALLADAILASALTRQESRGAHYRLDYPETLPNPPDSVWRWPLGSGTEVLAGVA